MRNLDLIENHFTHQLQIVEGREIDYSINAEPKDINNNGTWGKLIRHGYLVKSVVFNPNLTAPNFGKSDLTNKREWMLLQIEKIQKQSEASIKCASCESGTIYHNGSAYRCSHGLNYEDTPFIIDTPERFIN